MQTKEFSNYQTLLTEASKKLSIIHSDEKSFMELEGLFYDLLNMARAYSMDEENASLTRLKHIYENEYKRTQQLFKKAHQREAVIKKFKTALKKEVAICLTSISAVAHVAA
jgi:hypothetical protein